MLIEIYDYAAKLLNNMTATTATIINNLTAHKGVDNNNDDDDGENNEEVPEEEQNQEEEEKGERVEDVANPRRATNLTSKLLQVTTGNMKALLNHTLATMAGEHGFALPTLLLHGQRIKPATGNSSNSNNYSNNSSNFSNSSSISSSSNNDSHISHLSGNNSSSNSSYNSSSSSLEHESNSMYNVGHLGQLGNLSQLSNLSQLGFIESTTTSSTTTTAAAAAAAITHLPHGAASTFPAQTMATFIAAGNKNRPILYPTVSPESIVIPIVSCIFGFPILALIVICCLRRRAKLARERDRRRNYDMQDHAVSLITDRRELSVYVLNEA
ncbi:putative uncharacterized protein DDB_G0277255 isoform X2 [Drosophila albomicans]|uniref:Uncharacterized protein n=1 Tax=Drosophila albomicans TaxID=7291 RepID=A0A9C6WDQ7_DROAB|nr:putative uncharacterized protein DDB_G0277255 isoform X2 [Drosophila albomicans]